MIGLPVTAFHCLATAAWVAMPPATAKRNSLKSTVPMSGWLASAL